MLAYVIYYDNKGVLRKQTSWDSWRHKNIKPNDYDNIPTEGFVLNKKAGGYDTGWNHRNTYCRVWDPRGFEFEITIPNLLFILQETSSLKGKGLEGEFVYAWDGKDLVLLPASCAEYQNSLEFTKLQSGKVSMKEMVDGYTYETKNQEILTYVGKYDSLYREHEWNDNVQLGKRFVFLNKNNKFVLLPGIATLAKVHSDVVPDNYAALVEKFKKSEHSPIIKDVLLENVVYNKESNHRYYYFRRNEKDYPFDHAFIKENDNTYKQYALYPRTKEENQGGTGYNRYYNNVNVTIGFVLNHTSTVTVVDGVITEKKHAANKPGTIIISLEEIAKMNFKKLKVKIKNNKIFKVA
jgi:hypothetical protein